MTTEVDWDSDIYYNDFTDLEKIEFSRYYAAGGRGPHFLATGKSFGSVGTCPKCGVIRITSRCACMCGHCYTCGHTWVCVPVNPDVHYKGILVDLPELRIIDEENQNTN
jgi:hypothetical protein